MPLVLQLMPLVQLCPRKVGVMRITPKLLPKKPRRLCSDTISPVFLCCCLGVAWGLLLDRARAIACHPLCYWGLLLDRARAIVLSVYFYIVGVLLHSRLGLTFARPPNI